MSPDTLPFALLLLLAEFAAGCMLVLATLERRGTVPLGYIKVCAGTVFAAALFTLALVVSLPAAEEVGGYPLVKAWFLPARLVLALFAIASFAHNLAAYRATAEVRRLLALLAAINGLLALMLLAAIVERPTWGYAGTLLSLLAGGLSLGTVSLSMVLGHWYLVNPRLSEKPLNELTLALLAALVVQVAVVALNTALPVREVPASQVGFETSTAASPLFWLRVGVGLIFPLILGYMAWQSSRLRGMMSATGLLYIAMGAVLAGEALARGMLFATAAPL